MKYTVLLERPPIVAECEYDVYVAHVEAKTVEEAVEKARKELWKIDKRDGNTHPDLTSRDQYHFIMVFEGHAKPVAWPWETIYEHLNWSVKA